MEVLLFSFLLVPGLDACLPQVLVPIPKIANSFEAIPPPSSRPSPAHPPIYYTPPRPTPATTTFSFLQKVKNEAQEKLQEKLLIENVLNKTMNKQQTEIMLSTSLKNISGKINDIFNNTSRSKENR